MPGVAGLLSEKDKAPQPHLLLLPRRVCAWGVHAQRRSRPGCACMGRPWGLCTDRGGAASGWFTPRSEHSTGGVNELWVKNGGGAGPQQAPPPARTSHPPVLGVCLLQAQPPALETHAACTALNATGLLVNLGVREASGSLETSLRVWNVGEEAVCVTPPDPQAAEKLPRAPFHCLATVGTEAGGQTGGQRPGLAGKVRRGQKGQGLPRQRPRQRTEPRTPQVHRWAEGTALEGPVLGERAREPTSAPLPPQEATPRFWRI